jgi:hypothetical protein
LLHQSYIYCVHAHDPRNEHERQEDDGHGREYEYCLAVVLSSDFDRVAGLLFEAISAPLPPRGKGGIEAYPGLSLLSIFAERLKMLSPLLEL